MNTKAFPSTSRVIPVLAACLAASGPGTGMASEHLVEIAWRSDRGFDHAATIAPGKFVELCGKLTKGEAVQWQFDATAPLAFNIHYHQGKDVVYPAKLPQVDQARDVLSVPVDQDYCWMWTNRGKTPATLKMALHR